MSIQDRVSIFNDLIQASFSNAMNTVQSIHQTSAEMPLGVLKELGYPEERVEDIRNAHGEILNILYGGIKSANKELGNLIVLQTGELTKFAGSMLAAGYKSKPGNKWQSSKPAKNVRAADEPDKVVKSVEKPAATKKTAAKPAAISNARLWMSSAALMPARNELSRKPIDCPEPCLSAASLMVTLPPSRLFAEATG